MSNWLSWGIYATMIVEGGTQWGSTTIRWDRVESDYLYPNYSSLYGGGVGIIQFTSQNFEMLRQIVTSGYDMSGMADGVIKDNLLSGNKTINWHKGSWDGGLYTGDEMMFIKDMLNSDAGQKSNCDWIGIYMNESNGWSVNLLANSSMSDIMKAYYVNMIVLSPASITTLAYTNPSTLYEAKVNCLNKVGWQYEQRMTALENMFGTNPDLNTKPPIDYQDWKGETITNPPPPETSETGGDPPPNTVITVTEIPMLKINPTKPFYTKNNQMIQLGEEFKLTRFGDFYYSNFDYETVIVDNGNSGMENNSPPTVPDEPTPDPPTDPPQPNYNEILVEQVISELTPFGFNNNYFTYAGIRPQAPLNQVRYADCSSYIGWAIRNVHPVVWNNGSVNTSTIYRLFKDNGFVIWEGAYNDLQNQTGILKRGDLIEFSDNAYFGAGLNSHVVMYVGNDEMIDMNGSGNSHSSYSGTALNYYSFSNACIIRLYKE